MKCGGLSKNAVYLFMLYAYWWIFVLFLLLTTNDPKSSKQMFQNWTPQSENSQHSIWQNRPLITKPFPHSEQMEVLSVEMISCHYTLAQSWEHQIPPAAAWISARAPLGTVSTASAITAANTHVRNNTCCNAFNALLQILYSTKYWIRHAFRHNMTSLSSLDTAWARCSCLVGESRKEIRWILQMDGSE